MNEDEFPISCRRYQCDAAFVGRLWTAFDAAKKPLARRELLRTIITEAKGTIRCRRARSSPECQACLAKASEWRRLAQEELDAQAPADAGPGLHHNAIAHAAR